MEYPDNLLLASVQFRVDEAFCNDIIHSGPIDKKNGSQLAAVFS